MFKRLPEIVEVNSIGYEGCLLNDSVKVALNLAWAEREAVLKAKDAAPLAIQAAKVQFYAEPSAIIIEHHPGLINFLKNPPLKYDDRIMLIGSDSNNVVSPDFSPPSRRMRLPLDTFEVLAEQTKMVFNPFVMSDLGSHAINSHSCKAEAGDEVLEGTVAAPLHIIDKSLFRLLYAQIQLSVNSHPSQWISFNFYDARPAILTGLHALFSHYRALLPAKVVLRLWQYDGSVSHGEVAVPRLFEQVVGTGLVDMNYGATLSAWHSFLQPLLLEKQAQAQALFHTEERFTYSQLLAQTTYGGFLSRNPDKLARMMLMRDDPQPAISNEMVSERVLAKAETPKWIVSSEEGSSSPVAGGTASSSLISRTSTSMGASRPERLESESRYQQLCNIILDEINMLYARGGTAKAFAVAEKLFGLHVLLMSARPVVAEGASMAEAVYASACEVMEKVVLQEGYKTAKPDSKQIEYKLAAELWAALEHKRNALHFMGVPRTVTNLRDKLHGLVVTATPEV